jgi:pyruvate/2-oxoglutarate dehydrogenase complex dihydrolipoamide dehydrogenase (E3) component
VEEAPYDIIVIGAGSGGLSVSLFMHQAGFRTLLIDRADHHIGGDCLNDGCVPSKALIHVARLAHQAREATRLGLQVTGKIDPLKVTSYIHQAQETIRAHENADFFRKSGLDVALGYATFSGKNSVSVDSKAYRADKIIIATGSRPDRLQVPGVELVKYYDNESIFKLDQLPQRLLVIGGGPIGMEIGQALLRLGVEVSLIHRGERVLKSDPVEASLLLQDRLEREGMNIFLRAEIHSFTSPTTAKIIVNGVNLSLEFDAIFVATGRSSNIDKLQLSKAGIQTHNGKILANQYLRTTNKNVFVCGDVVGDLKFSHAAEHHARIILNNLFSPIKKKLSNDHLSWVTFTDPEVATFGLTEAALKGRKVSYTRLTTGFEDDDRAVVDDHRYAKLILFVSKGNIFSSQKILGGTMIAPNAGELIQELILANSTKLSINAIFNKIYPYPVAARINQKIMVELKSKSLTPGIKKLLKIAFKLFR